MERNYNNWAKINEVENKIMIYRFNETKSWFFEKINKIGKYLFKLLKGKR
jgi:hypothetical protein